MGGKEVGDWSREIERGEEGEREKEKERPSSSYEDATASQGKSPVPP